MKPALSLRFRIPRTNGAGFAWHYVDARPEETVHALVERLLGNARVGDLIEIRIVDPDRTP